MFVNLPHKVITTIMAFGSGVLIATSTFSILVEAFSVTHTLPATTTGFILGGVSFSIANSVLERRSKSRISNTKQGDPSMHKNTDDKNSVSGRSLFIGSLMDKIPVNAALGITLAAGGALNLAFLYLLKSIQI